MISTPNGTARSFFEALAQLAELLDDRVERGLALAAEQEAGVEDDEPPRRRTVRCRRSGRASRPPC